MENETTIPRYARNKRNTVLKAWLLALAILAAESTVDFVNPQLGMVVYLLVFSATMLSCLSHLHFIGATEVKPAGYNGYRFYLVLALIPLSRIINLGLPANSLSVLSRYAATGALITVASIIAVREIGYRGRDIYLRFTHLSFQGLAILASLLLIIWYLKLDPQTTRFIFFKMSFFPAALPILIIGSFIEEVIFRGFMLKTAVEHIGDTSAIIYVSTLNAAMSATQYNLRGIIFIALTSLLFTYTVHRTGSIIGASLGHILINVLGFGIML